MKLKPTDEVTACVFDYGYFPSLAQKLSASFRKVFYYAPIEAEYSNIKFHVIGEGIPNVTRLLEPFDPATFNRTDLFIFPDIGYAKLQAFLVEQDKAVWGSKAATYLELYRSAFLSVLKDLGLSVPKHKIVYGLSALMTALKGVKNKWIKLDIYRDNMETWHHIDYEHSIPMLSYLSTELGGAAETCVFVIQDEIPDAQENGYDGYCIDGQFPSRSFQGYEKKNELYLGAWMKNDDLPENIRMVNEAFAPKLKEIKYRNFFATEIRNEFFIDPTPRMAGQSQEQLLENCTNLADIVWHGANGELIEPDFAHRFGATATIHYEEVPGEGWRSIVIPKKEQKWFKMGKYMQDGEIYHFPPNKSDEIGVVIGVGDTIEDTINDLKAHLDAVENEPIHAEVEGFADILRDAKEAAKHGDAFTKQTIPSPKIVIDS